jgi:hypothetical protein
VSLFEDAYGTAHTVIEEKLHSQGNERLSLADGSQKPSGSPGQDQSSPSKRIDETNEDSLGTDHDDENSPDIVANKESSFFKDEAQSPRLKHRKGTLQNVHFNSGAKLLAVKSDRGGKLISQRHSVLPRDI